MPRLSFCHVAALSFALIVGALGACVPSRHGGGQRAARTPYPPMQQRAPVAAVEAPPTTWATAQLPPPVTATPSATASAPPLRSPRLGRAQPSPRTPRSSAQPGCGEVVVEGARIPLDCFAKDYARVEGSSQAISRASMMRSGAQLLGYVDHRREGLEGPVRKQEMVGSGVAMALAGAIDHALILRGVAGAQVSAMQLWARSPKPLLGPLVSVSVGKQVAAEATLPYDAMMACRWARSDAARLCASSPQEPPSASELARAEGAPFAKLVDVVELDGSNGELLRDTLAKQQDVLLVLRVEQEAWGAVGHAADVEPLIPDYVGTTAAHVVSIVGYALQDGQWFYLVKNSWGPGWGQGGYAWISEPTLKRNYLEAYVVQAAPAGAATGVVSSCQPGLVPDAVTKVCAPPCADGSPRVNSVCADPKSAACPAGFVNTSGACVVAAPERTAVDSTTGVRYVCGAAGCTYFWDKGTLGCAEATCSMSCPAPKFLASINIEKKTVTCTE